MIDHIQKSIGPLSLVFLFCLPLKVLGFDIWNLPLEPELKTLEVSNLSSDPQTLWLSGPRGPGQDSHEESFEIPAQSREDIPLSLFTGKPYLQLRSALKKTLKLRAKTSSGQSWELPAASQTRWKAQLPFGASSELILINNAPFEQTLSLQNSRGQILETHKLSGFEKIRIPAPRLDSVWIEGSSRISGLWVSTSQSGPWIPDAKPAPMPTPDSNSVYFLMSNSKNLQSYVLALKDPYLIAEARDQIQNPNAYRQRILIAEISEGPANQNRDFMNRFRTPWSWHISNPIRFAGLASQECDGSPQFLEETLAYWLAGSKVICFWNYRVTRELSADAVRSGQLP
jgi:hypothetical protein